MITSNFNKEINTFFQDIDDRISIEVGDSKQKNFENQCKIKGWGNEVNLSARLENSKNGNLITDKDVVKWLQDNQETHLYDIVKDEKHKEGAFEIEVLLLEKPKSNIISFTLECKGIDFFYQPELTSNEIKDGHIRPENVIGSYAVYCSQEKINWEGGKLYKAGKLCHIYRPKIIDSSGKYVWGILKIKNGLLTIEIPQDFLDTALYPVLVDPTLGYDTIGGSTFNASSANAYLTSLFTSTEAGTVSMLTAHTGSSAGANSKGILHTHGDLALVTNGTGSVVAIPAGGSFAWRDSTMTPSIVGSTEYLVGMIFSAASLIKYDAGSANQGHNGTNSYTTPTTLVTPTHTTNKASAYLTYTASAVPTILTKPLVNSFGKGFVR